MTTSQNTQMNNVMNPEQRAIMRASILANWQRKVDERAKAEKLRRARRLDETRERYKCSESEARLIMAAEDYPTDSISSVI